MNYMAGYREWESSERQYKIKLALWEEQYVRNRDNKILEESERLYQEKFKSTYEEDYNLIMILDRNSEIATRTVVKDCLAPEPDTKELNTRIESFIK